ncbi:Urea carboxylase-related aminomethyltransferase [Acetobacter malorum]|nr:Urea carboxylase-related aminomethyltransferase [Acetobacter malorum]
MGRVLLAISEDSCGWHDSFGGVLNAQEVEEKYGPGRYQELRNKFYRNGHDNLLVEMGKWNLNIQDLLMVVNFFSKVIADETGQFSFVEGNSSAGDYIDLYAPMDVLIILTALQHPMDPSPQYNPKPISFSLHDVAEDGISFGCHTSRPENGRAFFNTALYCV